MFGVILFLRLGVIVANAGLFQTLLVIGFGLLIMLLTSASVASIVSNKSIGAGGIYYIITRSLGIEMGGALGYALYFTQILLIALTTTGFAYLFVDLFPYFNVIYVEIMTIIILALVSNHSTHFALKFQGVILVVLILAVLAIFFGSAEGMTEPESTEPFYPGGLHFWQAFALLYPALTGIEAGMALSGSLKNPSRSLMYGNAISVIFAAIVYMILVTFAFNYIPMEALKSNPMTFVEFAHPSWFVMFGVCVAALSSSLCALITAPRIIKGMADDGIAHRLFSKTTGKNQEPRWGLIFTAFVSILITISANMDQIIPILTMICLFSYGLLNFVAALSSLMNAPSWQPEFKLPTAVSFFGCALCVIAMFVVNPEWSFITLFLILVISALLKFLSPDVNFSDIRASILFFLSRITLYRLSAAKADPLTWHPNLLVLSKSPKQHLYLIELVHSLTQQSGILSFGTVVPEAWSAPDKIQSTRNMLDAFFKKQNIECLVKIVADQDEFNAYINLIKSYGIGEITPNMIVLPTVYDSLDIEQLCYYTYQCHILRKNLLFYCESTRENTDERLIQQLFSESTNIDAWWDPKAGESFSLLINLFTILLSTKYWAEHRLTIRGISSDPEAKDHITNFLNNIVKKMHLSIDVVIYPEEDLQLNSKFIAEKSKDAMLVVIPLIPMTSENTFNEYGEYLAEFLNEDLKEQNCLLVTAYDATSHKDVLEN